MADWTGIGNSVVLAMAGCDELPRGLDECGDVLAALQRACGMASLAVGSIAEGDEYVTDSGLDGVAEVLADACMVLRELAGLPATAAG